MASNDFYNRLMGLRGNMLNYAFMLTSDRNRAHDLLDKVTVIALEHDEYASESGSGLKEYAFALMRKVFMSEHALHTLAHVPTKDDVYSLKLTRPVGAGTMRIEGAFSSEDVTRAMTTFTDDYRKLMACYFGGYSVDELVEEFGMSVSIVKTRIAYCRNRLRVMLSANS